MKTLQLPNVPEDVVCRLQKLSDRDGTSVGAVADHERSDVSRGADPRVIDGWADPGTLARPAPSCHTSSMDVTLVLGQQGRLVIPAAVREALGLAPGDHLHLHLSGTRLVLERPQDAAAELRGLAATVPSSRSLVDELLDERRRAAARGE